MSVERLAGDASTREFFRVAFAKDDGAGARSTVIAMVFDGPVDMATHAQARVGRHLEKLGFPIPGLRAASPEYGVLFFEDLGDRLLQDVVLAAEGAALRGTRGEPDLPGALVGLYEQAVAMIVDLQERGAEGLDPDHPSARQALDEQRFLFELRFFAEHFLAAYRGLRLGPRETQQLESFFAALAADAATGPRRLCHRDFHSRNLIVQDGRLRLIDYQDARMGPLAYDLASLLRDSYVVLPADLRERLLDRYLAEAADWVGDPAAFRRRFDVVALQRNLKAIGTFGYQAAVRGKPDYIPFMTPTWDYVFDELDRLPQYADIRPVLELAASR